MRSTDHNVPLRVVVSTSLLPNPS